MNDLTKLLTMNGYSDEDADKTFVRWWSWITDAFAKKRVGEHFKAIQEYDGDQLVVVKDIDVDLVCPHHLLPVMLKVHVGYLPNGKILGLSKFGRVAQDMAQPTTQEEYTENLMKIIGDNLDPKWMMIMISGEHTCMQCRGIKNRFSKTITSALFNHTPDRSALKKEFMDLVTHAV